MTHQLGHVPLQRQPGRVDQRRGLGDPDLRERILGRPLADVGGAHPLALVVDVGRVRTRRHADDRRGDGVGEYGAERDAVQRPRVELVARAGDLGDAGDTQRPVPGDEGVVHHDVVAAGAAQPDRVPHVVDGVVAGRQQERAEVHGLARVVGDDAAEQDPAGVVAAGGEAPPSIERVPVFRFLCPAGGGIGGGHPGGRVGAPDVVLGLLREQGELPGVHADHRGDPAGGPARDVDQPDRGEERDRVRLQAARGLRLEQPEETRLFERLDRLGRDDAGVFGLLGALSQGGEQFADSSGALHVLDAYCRHMGGDLSQGTVKGDAIACPFHDWRWGGDGRCAGIPYARRVPVAARTRAWRTLERNGHLFVWNDPEGNAPPDDVTIPFIEGASSDEWTSWTWDSILVEGANCREVIDNVVDMAHFFYIHFAFPTFFKNVFEGHIATQYLNTRSRPDIGGVSNYTSAPSQSGGGIETSLRSEASYYGPAYMID